MRYRERGWRFWSVAAVAVIALMGSAHFAGVRLVDAWRARGLELAPAVSVQLLDGSVVSLSSLEGKVVLLNFWATWCPPCRLEMPGFQRVYEARRDDGFTIVGLSTDQLPDEAIRTFLEQRGIEYPVGRMTRYVADAYGGANTLPTSFLIDADGRIRRQVTGAYDEAELVRDVDGLLREAGLEPTGEVAVWEPEPPVVGEVEAVGHVTGSTTAPITVIEFSDYGCSYCSRFTRESFPSLYKEFIEAGTVRWVHLPFVLGKFPNAEEAAAAAVCASEQGESVFQATHQALFRRQAEWRSAADPLPVLRGWVEVAGGDGDAFTACFEDDRARADLARVEDIAMRASVAATPTFFVNGQRVEGALPLAAFQEGFRAMLR